MKELQRRNVFRVTLGYVVSGWLLMQVADIALESFGSPDWVMRTIILLLALGFPIVVFFSWAYEVTPEGIKRESEVDRSESITHVTGHKLDRAIIAVLAVALCYFAYDKYFAPEAASEVVAAEAIEEDATKELDKSIAVLPFVNMSGDESSAYFSDGLADTVLHMLAQVSDLRVAARTSSFQFRDQALGIEEIGQQLNVSSILEGSVQKSGDKIRVTAQLIDVSNGFHLWSGNFDRDLNDVFVIQDEIATEVVAALKLSLLGESSASLTKDRTDNLDAYTEYLLAVEELNTINSESLNSAANHLQEAIRLDPEYARAYSTLGRTYLLLESWGAIGKEQGLAAARDAASRALDIDPTSSEALAVLGRAADRDGDSDLAGELLAKAIEIGPNDAVALNYYGIHLGSINQPEEREAIFRKMIRLDPLSEDANLGYSATLVGQDNFEQALDVLADFRIVQPDSQRAIDQSFSIEILQGNFAKVISGLEHEVGRHPNDPDPERPNEIGLLYLSLDMPADASLWFDRAIEIDAQHPVSRSSPLLLDYYRQEVDEDSFRLARELLADHIDSRFLSRFIALLVLTEYGAKTDRHELVLDTLDNLYPHLFEDPPQDLDKDITGTFIVGETLRNSGETERGLHLLNAVHELGAANRLAYGTHGGHMVFAAALGRKADALARLSEYQERSRFDYLDKMFYKHASQYDLLREEPAFVTMLENYDTHIAEQRQLLQAMLESPAEQ